MQNTDLFQKIHPLSIGKKWQNNGGKLSMKHLKKMRKYVLNSYHFTGSGSVLFHFSIGGLVDQLECWSSVNLTT